MCRICYLPAGDCHIPAPGVCHAGTGIIIGTRTVRVLYEIGATSDTRQPFGDCRSWWLPIKLPCTHCPTPQAHHHVELKQSTSVNIADVGGSSSSGSAAEDDLGSRQQGGSPADPGVDTIELFLPHMYLFPCVGCIKLALAHTFTFAVVHPA